MSATLGSTLRTGFQPVPETSYQYDARIASQLNELSARVRELRGTGRLSAAVLKRLRNYFKVKNIHHSNAIEGNLLDYGETRVVVEEGLTITGKPLKDTLEAKNLAHALNLFEELADREGEPIRGTDIRNIHRAILHGLDVENAGKYRTVNVEVSGSHYRPPGPESVPALMDEFCRWLEPLTTPSQREVGLDPLVVACAAHAWFVYIHPFVDGNGRTARILMNLVLIRYGYPIAIITKDDRQRYYDALEESQASDLTPFLSLIQECVLESLEEYQRAAEEQAITHEWARSVATKLGEAGLTRAHNEYEVWKSAMELFKGHCRETVQLVNEQASAHGLVRLFFKDFGTLEFEKYLSLRNGQSAKKTWFFRLDFKSGDRAARYLFFFGFPSYQMQGQVGSQTVTLHIAKETVPFFYERLDQITTTNNPLVWEIAYRQALQDFVARYGQRVAPTKIEPLVRNFVTEVAQRDF